jgi:hypothetical protein
MPKYELLGESLAETVPAHVETLKIFGVEVLRITGTEEEITATTKILDEVYTAMHAFGDAQLMGYVHLSPDGKRPVPLYQLTVIRKVFPNERREAPNAG